MYVWPHELTIVRTFTGEGPGPYDEDPYGNEVPTEPSDAETRHTAMGLFGASTTTTDFGTPEEPSRFVTTALVLLEPSADVRSGDDLEYDGRRWRIVGEPVLISDLQGRPRQYEVTAAGYGAEELVGS